MRKIIGKLKGLIAQLIPAKDFKTSKGTTFVELTIVLVAIGLVIAAVLYGQSMIKQAKVTSLVQETEANVENPIALFREKYGRIPGDADGNGEIDSSEIGNVFQELTENNFLSKGTVNNNCLKLSYGDNTCMTFAEDTDRGTYAKVVRYVNGVEYPALKGDVAKLFDLKNGGDGKMNVNPFSLDKVWSGSGAGQSISAIDQENNNLVKNIFTGTAFADPVACQSAHADDTYADGCQYSEGWCPKTLGNLCEGNTNVNGAGDSCGAVLASCSSDSDCCSGHCCNGSCSAVVCHGGSGGAGGTGGTGGSGGTGGTGGTGGSGGSGGTGGTGGVGGTGGSGGIGGNGGSGGIEGGTGGTGGTGGVGGTGGSGGSTGGTGGSDGGTGGSGGSTGGTGGAGGSVGGSGGSGGGGSAGGSGGTLGELGSSCTVVNNGLGLIVNNGVCAAGLTCFAATGECMPTGYCRNDSDCPNTERCSASICVSSGTVCNACAIFPGCGKVCGGSVAGKEASVYVALPNAVCPANFSIELGTLGCANNQSLSCSTNGPAETPTCIVGTGIGSGKYIDNTDTGLPSGSIVCPYGGAWHLITEAIAGSCATINCCGIAPGATCPPGPAADFFCSSRPESCAPMSCVAPGG